jgi:hypothetical protein
MSETADTLAAVTGSGLTTMPSPVDMPARFPVLAGTARETVRLHPRPGSPDERSSSLGGPLLWPADQPWPACDSPWCTLDDRHPPRRIELGDSPLVPLLQVFARHVPQVPFPEGLDVLQVLWCPFFHQQSEPLPRVIWRREADLERAVAGDGGVHPEAPAEQVPSPCTVTPELVMEYSAEELDRDQIGRLADAAGELEAETGWDLWSDLLVAPGSKLGGHPSWVQNPEWPQCACGARMAHLATIASWEYDGVFSRRWIPVQEQPLFDLRAGQGSLFAQHPEIRRPHGMMLGDAGNYHLFTCTACPDRPYEHRWACS